MRIELPVEALKVFRGKGSRVQGLRFKEFRVYLKGQGT